MVRAVPGRGPERPLRIEGSFDFATHPSPASDAGEEAFALVGAAAACANGCDRMQAALVA